MSEYKVPIDKVVKFLNGHDPEQYIVNIEYDHQTNLIHKFKHLPDGTKTEETEPFRAFLWMKNLGELKVKLNFYKNSDLLIRSAREKFGIEILNLEYGDNDKLFNGFRHIVMCNQGYNKLLKFFEEGGFNDKDNHIYNGIFSKRYNIKDHFLILTPVEQYLIQTGKRLYKGYEDYDNLEKFVFDLETTGLDPEKDRIFLAGCKTNKGFEEIFCAETEGENANKTEVAAIAKFFKAIEVVQPAIITGYNSSTFDWNFIFKRCEKLNVDITHISKTLKSNVCINRKDQMVKLGGDVEDYVQTNMFGYSIIDALHAVRRAQAIDSNLKFASLKYVCKYNKIAKKNRVYVEGSKIHKIYNSGITYYFDERTGAYSENKPAVERLDSCSPEYFQMNKKKVFLSNRESDKKNVLFLNINSDKPYDEYKDDVNKTIKTLMNHLKKGRTIVISDRELGLTVLKTNNPEKYKFIDSTFNSLKTYAESFTEVDSKFIIKRYLIDDLLETAEVDNVYNQTSFMLAKIVPTSYQKVCTIGPAGLWKLIMLAWSYEQNIAIPEAEEKRDFIGGLSRLVLTGYVKRLRKLDFNSLYPSLQLLLLIFPEVDISDVLRSILKYFHSERFKAKALSDKYKKEGNGQMASFYKRKQQPLKVFINAMFGAISSPTSFQWAQIDKGEQITCSARQFLRLLMRFFTNKGYTITQLDTDGVNCMAPENEDDFVYVGLGKNDNVNAGETYTGTNAVVAEFNDRYMRGEMGLGFDGSWRAGINIARKNYALLEDDGSISKTGNTIKSKKMPEYIEEFLDQGLKMLLDEKGQEFIQYYYSYIDKIYNKEIPLSKIATKGRVKKTIEQYKNRGKNKKGKQLPKQAHMELAIINNISINLGDMIYYVNCGTKKSHGDSKEDKNGNVYAKYIDSAIIERDPDMLGEYNVERYLAMFNARIKGMLVVFDKSIRNKILITDPTKKISWLKSELEFVNGQPTKEKDQDSLEGLFIPSETEIAFWEKLDYNPDFWFEEKFNFTILGLDEVMEV